VAPLKPSKLTDRVMYVLFVTKCTQDLEMCEGSFEHVIKHKCAHLRCSKFEAMDDLSVDCDQCGTRTHMF